MKKLSLSSNIAEKTIKNINVKMAFDKIPDIHTLPEGDKIPTDKRKIKKKKKIFDKSMKKTRYRSSKLISMKRKPKNQDSHDRYEKWRKMLKNKYEVGSIETDQISQKEETPI